MFIIYYVDKYITSFIILGVTIADCYPHIHRNMLKNKGLMKNSTTFLPVVYECLVMLHLSANKNIFKLISRTILREWRDMGEGDFADYFHRVITR